MLEMLEELCQVSSQLQDVVAWLVLQEVSPEVREAQDGMLRPLQMREARQDAAQAQQAPPETQCAHQEAAWPQEASPEAQEGVARPCQVRDARQDVPVASQEVREARPPPWSRQVACLHQPVAGLCQALAQAREDREATQDRKPPTLLSRMACVPSSCLLCSCLLCMLGGCHRHKRTSPIRRALHSCPQCCCLVAFVRALHCGVCC